MWAGDAEEAIKGLTLKNLRSKTALLDNDSSVAGGCGGKA
jgi:hypothetical protein